MTTTTTTYGPLSQNDCLELATELGVAPIDVQFRAIMLDDCWRWDIEDDISVFVDQLVVLVEENGSIPAHVLPYAERVVARGHR